MTDHFSSDGSDGSVSDNSYDDVSSPLPKKANLQPVAHVQDTASHVDGQQLSVPDHTAADYSVVEVGELKQVNWSE